MTTTPTPPPAEHTVEPARNRLPQAEADQALAQIAEDEDRLPRPPHQWLLLILVAVIVGASTGVVGAAFRWSLVRVSDLIVSVAHWSHQHSVAGSGVVLPILLSAACAALGCYLSQRFAPSASGSGIPRVEAVLRNHVRPADAWILPVKFFGGILSIGSGMLLGREGPTVQMGGTIGRLWADRLARFVPEPWTMIAAGAGAGVAVAFNTPLAATLFVVEELLHRFSARVFSATLAACISGTIVLRLMLGNQPELAAAAQSGPLPAVVLPDYLLLGVIAGFVGVGFNVGLMRLLGASDRLSALPRGSRGLMVGALIGLMIYILPTATGGGGHVAEAALLGHFHFALAIELLLVRFVLTLLSYGTGAPGGLFAPLLGLGALLGAATESVNVMLHHPSGGMAPLVIVAMAALFTAVVRSPLTGVVLLLEMTGAWTLILPMMAASLTAYSVPELMGNPPLYDSLRDRDVAREKMMNRR